MTTVPGSRQWYRKCHIREERTQPGVVVFGGDVATEDRTIDLSRDKPSRAGTHTERPLNPTCLGRGTMRLCLLL